MHTVVTLAHVLLALDVHDLKKKSLNSHDEYTDNLVVKSSFCLLVLLSCQYFSLGR